MSHKRMFAFVSFVSFVVGVAMVRSGSEVSLWINGTKQGTTGTFSGTIHSGTAPLRIGATADVGLEYYFDGIIDEVRVSNFARHAFYNATLTYDNNGNLTSDGDLKYCYDVFNRMVKAKKAADDSTIADYVYDGTGRRVLKTVGSDATRYVLDGNDVIAEYNQNDALVCRYIMGRSIDEPMRMERLIEGNWHNFYYQTNSLGTIAALTEWEVGTATEKIVELYAEDAYGRLSVKTPGTDGIVGTADDGHYATSSVGNSYGFTGRALDGETGLVYYRARYYSTLFGRFVARDPLGYVDGMNLYGYCRDNPVNRTDPRGTDGEGQFEQALDICTQLGPPPDANSVNSIPTAAEMTAQQIMNLGGTQDAPAALLGSKTETKVIAVTGQQKTTKSKQEQKPAGAVGTVKWIWPLDAKRARSKKNDLTKCNWTEASIQATMDRPVTTRRSKNKANGNPATVYYNQDGSYVVRDDKTGELVQMSNRNDPDWRPDSEIIDPWSPPRCGRYDGTP